MTPGPTLLWVHEEGATLPAAFSRARGLSVVLGPEVAVTGFAEQGLASAGCAPERLLDLARAHLDGLDVLAIQAPVAMEQALGWCLALRPRLVQAPTVPGLSEALGSRGWQVTRRRHAWVAEAPPQAPEEAVLAVARQRYATLLEQGALAEAEPIIAGLAAWQPDDLAVQQAALGCNMALGQAARARRFARAVLRAAPQDPVAHLAVLDAHVAAGDHAAALASRRAIALAPAGVLNPLRQMVEAHRVVSDALLRPGRCDMSGLVAHIRALPAEGHWAWHYRSLIEAADPALLATETPLPSAAATGDARAVLLVAADARYVQLYGETYLRSVLAHLDVPARIVLHVIGGGWHGASPDPRVTITQDGFDAAAVTTRCHDSDGPRAIPVAHLQSIRFAQAERWLARTGLPVIVSDIDVILQRGIADLLARHAGDDVVLNRNAASQAFGSHLTANLAMLMPTPGGRAFAADLRGYLDRALARPDVTRWIDQCGLQMVWHAHASDGATRFGWFDTSSDINNVIYPRWAPNPFRFLSLFHGFDMRSLPARAA